MKIIISRPAKLILASIADAGSIGLIRLRASLGWEVGKFAEAFISLESNGLITRVGSKVELTEAGMQHFHLKVAPNDASERSTYRECIEAPKLDVSLPYLPNYARFRAAQAKNLYTGGASVAHPE